MTDLILLILGSALTGFLGGVLARLLKPMALRQEALIASIAGAAPMVLIGLFAFKSPMIYFVPCAAIVGAVTTYRFLTRKPVSD